MAIGAAGWPTPQAQRGSAARASASTRVAGYSFDLINQYARDTSAYTQGLVFHKGRLFESTGLYGESTIREIDLTGGAHKVVRSRALPEGLPTSDSARRYQLERLKAYGYSTPQVRDIQKKGLLFGEGLALNGDLLFQLTWVEGQCLVWKLGDWRTPVRVATYSGDGWGLASDGTHLVASDGSATLRFRDPATFAVTRSLTVTDPRSGEPVTQLNELEYAGRKLLANIYGTRRVAVIDPASGRLEAYVVFDAAAEGLDGAEWRLLMSRRQWDQLDARGEVLNGMAWDPSKDRLFVTGKHWPFVYEIAIRKVTDALP